MLLILFASPFARQQYDYWHRVYYALPCAVHSLHLIVKNVIRKLPENNVVAVTIQRCKNLESFFHQGPKAARYLTSAMATSMEEGEKQPQKLIQSNMLVSSRTIPSV